MSEPQGRELTQKMRAFTLRVFQTDEPTSSYMQIYKVKSKRTAAASATRLLKKDNIQAYLTELRQKTVDDSVATVLERKQVLTEIIRARQTDFMTCSADGVWMHDIGEDSLNTAALRKIETTTMPFGSKDSDLKIILTKVELDDKIRATDLLNKMGGDYPPVKTELTGKDGGPVEVQVDARAKIIGLISRYATRTRDERDDPELDRPGS